MDGVGVVSSVETITTHLHRNDTNNIVSLDVFVAFYR